MNLNYANARERVGIAFHDLFGGRIARTTFVIRIGILAVSIYLLSLPFETIQATSTKSLLDGYRALFLVILAICLIGFVSAYVKRLHDIGLAGYWAIVLLIGIPFVLGYLGDSYYTYRRGLLPEDSFDSLADVSELTGLLYPLGIILPLILMLWKGQKSENRFGDVPAPVEHIKSSNFSIIAIVGTAAILIPTCIYVGLFQSGVWVGRGPHAPSFPMIDSRSKGKLIAKCWNIKGVGAGSGKGDMSGVYRDGYGDSVLDFMISDDGQIDVVPAGATLSKAYRADGFEIYSYGFDIAEPQIERSRFMIAAIYDGSKMPEGNVNFTTFSFAKTGEIWPEWQMIMSSGLSLGNQMLLNPNEQARGRLMVGDCMVN